jgi:hypothetical protein
MYLPEIAGVDHDTFVDFYDYSHQIDFAQMPALYDAFDALPMNPDWNFNDALSFVNLPPMPTVDVSSPIVDISMPTMDIMSPTTPMLDPQQQLDLFQNTMMDVQHNMITMFPDATFMPDPMYQYPTLDMSGMGMDIDFTPIGL